jgi:HSP20 family protein
MKGLIKRSQNVAKHTPGKKAWLKRADISSVIPSFRHDMDEAFERMWHNLRTSWPKTNLAWPAVDIDEDEKVLHIRLDTPGVDPKDVDVELSGNLLTIRGTRQSQRQVNHGSVHHHERISGSFYRTIPLPEYVDAAKTEARFDKGVLNIAIPKIPGQGSRRVPITA